MGVSFAYRARSPCIARQQEWKLQLIIFPIILGHVLTLSPSHLLQCFVSIHGPPLSFPPALALATQIDSAFFFFFLISQRNPINFIVIAAINI